MPTIRGKDEGVPAHTLPTVDGGDTLAPAAPRLDWLDLARGTAVVSMVFAHTWPWGGLWAVVEYVTAPWFALLIGISLSLVWQKRRSRPGLFLFDCFVRGLLLILLGVGLQGLYGQIVVVLQTWGALVIVLAPLLWVIGGRPGVALLLSLTLAVVSPVLMGVGREWIATQSAPAPWLVQVVNLLVSGHYYRTSSFLAGAAAGVGLAPRLTRRQDDSPRPDVLMAVVLFVAASVVYLVGGFLPGGAEPDSGTAAEILGSILLSLSATWFCVWLVRALGKPRTRRWLGAVVDTGRMSLTAYTVQIVALAAIVRLWLPGQRDDHWWVTLLVTALCLGSSWLWLRHFRHGPLETIIRLPGRLAARRAAH